jgi:type II secretory pathway component GspD/PulD (secretin)
MRDALLNRPNAAKPAIAARSHAQGQWRGLADSECWVRNTSDGMNPVKTTPAAAFQRGTANRVSLLPVIVVCLALMSCCCRGSASENQTFSSFDRPSTRADKARFDVGTIRFESADLSQLLMRYQEISGRTVIRHGGLLSSKISATNQTPLNAIQALQFLDTILAENGITMVLVGETAVKAVPEAAAQTESPPEITLPVESLPESLSYMSRTVHVKNVQVSSIVPALAALAKMPGSIVVIKDSNDLLLRDYSSNVRRMLLLLEEVEKNAVRR